MSESIKYPVGQQSFEQLRKGDYLYVDKTQYIERILGLGQYLFLARPRRFGKSLFLSTLKSFFEGKRNLFAGLHIESIDWDWKQYPVLLLDLNPEKYKTKESLDFLLDNQFSSWEREYGVENVSPSYSIRFKNIIEAADAKSDGAKVVILIDEYDKPLVNNLNDRAQFEHFRDLLSTIYGNFKTCADHIQLVFLTGVTRFGKLSIFSDLNNLKSLTFEDDFDAVCGITHNELLSNFQEGISDIAEKLEIGVEETIERLKSTYDGYRFTGDGQYIYNPFSLLNVMQSKRFRNYWIESGTPTILVEHLKRSEKDLSSIINSKATTDDLSGLDFDNMDPAALLYQTGYITIKEYYEDVDGYRLGLPNKEVTKGFFSYLLPFFSNMRGEKTAFFVKNFEKELENGEVANFMKRLQSMFANAPYNLKLEEERDVETAIYMLVTLMGFEVRAEERTSNGRIDIFIRTSQFYYIIELKFNGTPEEALEQINRKHYALPFGFDGKKVIKIGANFSSESRTIDRWVIG